MVFKNCMIFFNGCLQDMVTSVRFLVDDKDNKICLELLNVKYFN